MRVLFVSQYLYRPDQPAANRIYDFLQRLAKRGHEPHVVAGGVHYLQDSIDPDLAQRKLIETRWGDVPVTVAYASPNFRKGVLARLKSYFSFTWYAMRGLLRVRDVDVIVVSIQPFFVAPLAWLVSKLRRVPFIVDVRDLWPDAAVECGLIRSKFLIRLGRMFEMFVYKRAHHITVIGPRMKQAIIDKGIDPDKIDVMPQGYQPPERPPIDRESARARLGLGDEFVLMFTGSFGLANNDLPLIVDAAIRLKDEPGLRIVFVGEGNLKAECIDRCRDAGVTNVTFLPIVPKNEIPDLLAAADASVMTLPPGEFWEICLQNKFFDYMGNGLPLVAAVAGDQERILRESKGGIVVEPRDLDGLVRAILELKQQPDLRRELGGNARRYVSENLMRSQIVDNYVDLLEQLVESPRA